MTSCRGEHVNLKIQLLTLQLPKCFCFYLCFLLKLPVLWWTHSRNVPKSVLSRAWVLVFDSEVGTRCNSHVFLGPLEKANIRSVSVATELDLPSFGNFCWQGHASTEFGKTDLVVQRHHSTDAWIMQRYYKDALPTFNITPTGKNRFPTIIFQGLCQTLAGYPEKYWRWKKGVRVELFACFDTSPKIWSNSSSNMESCNQIWIFFERRVWHSDGSTFTHWWKIQSRQRFKKKWLCHKKILHFFTKSKYV